MEYAIRVVRETLTDGSFVYNIRLGDAVFHACSENDATKLADTLFSAINEHTVDTAEIHW